MPGLNFLQTLFPAHKDPNSIICSTARLRGCCSLKVHAWLMPEMVLGWLLLCASGIPVSRHVYIFPPLFQTKTTVKGLPGLGLAWSSQLIDKAQEACTPSVLAYPAMPPGLTLRCSLTLSLSMDHWVHPILCIPVNLGFKCNSVTQLWH